MSGNDRQASILPDVTLICLHLFHIPYVRVLRKLTFSYTIYDSKAMKEKTISGVPVTVAGLYMCQCTIIDELTLDACRESHKHRSQVPPLLPQSLNRIMRGPLLVISGHLHMEMVMWATLNELYLDQRQFEKH